MPIYEYHCDRCDHKYDLIRTLSRRDEPAPCPKCGEPGARQLSSFGFKYGGHYYGLSGRTQRYEPTNIE